MSTIHKKLKFFAISFTCTIAFSSSFVVLADPKELPPVTVTGSRITNWTDCTGSCIDQFMNEHRTDWGDMTFDEMGFWEWLFPEPPPTEIPDMPGNNFKADCGSNMDSRFEHANSDVKTFVGLEMQGGRRGPLVRGEIVSVTYDDGSTEQWTAVGASSTYVLEETPVANSLKCE